MAATDRVWAVRNFRDELHIIPKHDPRQHRLIGCWCKPTFDKNKRALSPVWVHHASRQTKAVQEEALDQGPGGAEELL